jgi:hypothetical protein
MVGQGLRHIVATKAGRHADAEAVGADQSHKREHVENHECAEHDHEDRHTPMVSRVDASFK